MSFNVKQREVCEGDTVVVYLGINNIYTFDIVKGKVFQCKYGALKHDDMVGKRFGSMVQCSKGWACVLQPTPELWTQTLPHRTQIIYTPDISIVLLELDIQPGKVVCESGTGSGSLSHAFIRAVAPTGYLHTFDFHEQRVQIASEEFEKHGLASCVSVKHRDVINNGFGLENVADAVFLDIPKPWSAIQSAKLALKVTGGRFCSFSPCIEQVQKTCLELTKLGFCDIKTLECTNRPLDVRRVQLPSVQKGYGSGAQPPKTKQRKLDDATEKTDEKQEPAASNFKGNRGPPSTITAIAPPEVAGHTGFLTFATLHFWQKPKEEIKGTEGSTEAVKMTENVDMEI